MKQLVLQVDEETIDLEQQSIWDFAPDIEPNLLCDCGSRLFKVCWYKYHYVGGYCRIVCASCGADAVLIDDYA